MVWVLWIRGPIFLLILWTMPLAVNESNPALCHAIAQQIMEQPQQRISFADFMALALYHPQHGYYATNQVNIGVRGDFFTAPHLGRDFGEMLAEQLVEMWQILGQPQPYMLIEMGAGQGLLAGDILRYLQHQHPDCLAAVQYIIIEKASGLIAEQKRLLQRFLDQGIDLSWRTWEEIPANSLVGCCFSNELVDAFPVHRVMVQDGELREIYVTLEQPPGTADLPIFQEEVGDLSTAELADYFKLIDLPFPSAAHEDGYHTEINLDALGWIKTVSDRIQRGYLLTIDYGYPASRYYSAARSQGTLQCYYQHAHHNDPYRHVGYQDITAHVDFTALEAQGQRWDLDKVGATQQALFLMALGLGDRIAALSEVSASTPLQEVLRRRQALHELINPMGLGNFNVLIQSKGLSEAERQHALRGLTVPPLM